jgi:hypothetical protein
MAKDPRDLTLGDCFAAGYTVSVWCSNRCPGRFLPLSKLGKWADHKLLDLMRDGAIVCTRCDRPATFVSVSAHLVVGPVLKWQIGDDAMPESQA